MLDPLCLHNVLSRPSSGGELEHGSVADVGFPKLENRTATKLFMQGCKSWFGA